MVTLSLKDGGTLLGTIDEADLQLMIGQLEEEDEADTDYYIDPATIEFLAQRGASAALIGILKQAVGDSEGVDVVWERSGA